MYFSICGWIYETLYSDFFFSMMSVWTSAVLPLVKIKIIKPRRDGACFNRLEHQLQPFTQDLFRASRKWPLPARADRFCRLQPQTWCFHQPETWWPISVSSWEAAVLGRRTSANTTSCLRFLHAASIWRLAPSQNPCLQRWWLINLEKQLSVHGVTMWPRGFKLNGYYNLLLWWPDSNWLCICHVLNPLQWRFWSYDLQGHRR